MCRAKSEGGRRCRCEKSESSQARATLRRAERHHERAQEDLRAFVGATPFRPESEELQALSGRNTYYASDEWIEYRDYVDRAADRHEVELTDHREAEGLWEGETEPSGACRAAGAPEDIRRWAADVAGRYDQDSVMVAWSDPNGNAEQHTYNVPAADTETVLEALQEAGVPGGRVVDGKLEVIMDRERSTATMFEGALAARFGEPAVTRVRAEFVEKNPAKLSHHPIKEIQMIRQVHAERHGLPVRERMPVMTETDDIASAMAYDAAEHQPGHPKVQRSYRAFRRHIREQHDALTAAGYSFKPWHGENEQPYADSSEMINDLRENKRLYFFRTEVSQDSEGALPPDHPMAQDMTVTTADGQTETWCANDVFRAVHDSIAHSEGHTFGPKGEKQAWWTHRSSLPREAHLALWNETRAQNTWTNAGPHMRTAGSDGAPRLMRPEDEGWVPIPERPYAAQKCVVVSSKLY